MNVKYEPRAPFSYEKVRGSAYDGWQYRIRDADDNRLATCYVEENAKWIVAMLNKANSGLPV